MKSNNQAQPKKGFKGFKLVFINSGKEDATVLKITAKLMKGSLRSLGVRIPRHV